MSHKPLLFHGCLISIGTIIALVIVEFVLRFFPLIQFPVGIPLTSTWLIFLEHPSGSVRLLFDEYGNRSERTYVESQQGSPRVMIIGDSHSFGVGVSQDEMYSSLLERKLQESTEAPAARVLNISRMGTSLLQYARFFHEFEDFDPDTIILGIYSGNDLLDYWIDKQREVTVEHAYPYPPFLKHDLSSFDKLKHALRRFHLYHLISQARNAGGGNLPSAKEIQYLGPFVQSYRQAEYFLHSPQELNHAAHAFAQDTQRYFADLGKEVLLLLLPSPLLIDKEKDLRHWKNAAHEQEYTFEELSSIDAQIYSTLLKYLSESPFQVVSLKEHLPTKREHTPLYYEKDCHLNTEGHRLVSQILLSKLEHRGRTQY